MKFLVDQPLAGLARWLRLCGFDAGLGDFSRFFPPPSPEVYCLTRRQEASRLKRPDILVLGANDPDGQLAEVFRRLGLNRRDLAPLSRCGECNDLLHPLPRESALGLVPDYVFHTQRHFFRCPRCGRVYWPGSHPARITARLEEIIKLAGPADPELPSSQKGVSHGL